MTDVSPSPSSHTDAASSIGLELPGADVTLLSTDNVRFHVHKLVLSLASPFFSGMFAIPSTATESNEIPMTESSTILRSLLHFIYPLKRHSIVDIDEAHHLIHVARKYELVSIEQEILRQSETLLAAESNPIRAWAFAVRMGSHSARQTAMERVLRIEEDDYDDVVTSGKAALRYVNGEELHDLWKWRLHGIRQAREAIRVLPLRHVCCEYESGVGRPATNTYRCNMPAELKRIMGYANPFAQFSESLMTLAKLLKKPCGCSGCTRGSGDELRAIQRKTAEVLDLLRGRHPYLEESQPSS